MSEMSITEAIKSRRSIRKYKPDPVPEEIVLELLEAARLAPSSSNSQPWRFLVINKPEQIKAVAGFGGNQNQLVYAPLIIVCCGDTSSMSSAIRNNRRSELREAGVYDDIGDSAVKWIQSKIPVHDSLRKYIPTIIANVYISIEHIVLRAVSFGLGTCWIGAFDGEKLGKYLELPEEYFIVSLLTVGWPAQTPKARPRLPLSEIVINHP